MIWFRYALLAAVTAAVTFFAVGANTRAAVAPATAFQARLHAVFLTGGQVYFGHIEKAGPPFLEITGVYYVRSVVGENKQTSNVLVRRGQEWHGPDRMFINASEILFVEPVGEGSQVAKLIAGHERR